MKVSPRVLLILVCLSSGPIQAQVTGQNRQTAALCEAIQTRRWQEALRLVQAGASATNLDSQGRSALPMLASRWHGAQPEDSALRLRLLSELLERGADPYAAARSDFHPRGDSSVIEWVSGPGFVDRTLGDWLLTNRPSPDRRTPSGDTALHLAAKAGRTNVVTALLAAGFSVDQPNNDSSTPLQLVVSSSGPGTFVLTNEYPPLFMSWPGKGQTRISPTAVAVFLIESGASVGIHTAAGMGMTNHLVSILRTNPVAVQLRDGLGRTALHYAVSNGQTNTVAHLLRAGADVSIETASGSTPLHLACSRELAGIARLLLENGASPARSDADGNTLLHLASNWGRTDCVSLLIQHHAPLDVTNGAGKTPLRITVERGNFANTELLLKSGARVDVGPSGSTLLHVAASQGRPEHLHEGPNWSVAKMAAQSIPALLRHGLAVDARDGEGCTPFQRAVTSLNWSAMNLLLTNGANVNAVDARGDSALHQVVTQRWEMAEYEKPDWGRFLRPMNGSSTNVAQQAVRGSPWTNSSVTAWLIEHGSDPNSTNHAGKTPLELVCTQTWGRYDMDMVAHRIATLTNAGANVSSLSDNARAFVHHLLNTQKTP